MKGLGIFLLLLGAGSFILPMLGYQFKLISIIPEDIRPVVGGVMAAVGAVLLFLGFKYGGAKEEKK